MNKQPKSFIPNLVRPQNCAVKNNDAETLSQAESWLKANQYFEVYSTDNISNEMREKYNDAVDFVNFCHRIMNKLLRKKCTESGDMDEQYDFKIPECAKFLRIFDLLLNKTSKNNHKRSSSPDTKNHPDNNLLVKHDEKNEVSVITDSSKVISTKPKCSPPKISSDLKNNLNSSKGKLSSPSKQNNLSRKLLQNKIKQCNLDETIHIESTGKNISKSPTRKQTEVKQASVSTPRPAINKNNSPREEPLPCLEIRKTPVKEATSPNNILLFDHPEYDNYLESIINKQIQTFLDSPRDDSYVKKHEKLDIDNFRIVNITGDLDLSNYTVLNNKPDAEDNSRHDFFNKSKKSNKDYEEVDYRNIDIDKYAIEEKPSNANNKMPKRVESMFANVQQDKLEENNQQIRKSETTTILRDCEKQQRKCHYDFRDTDDENSTIFSDDDLDFNIKMGKLTQNSICSKSVTRVLDAFKPKKKSVNSSNNNKTSNQEDFAHPLKLNKRDLQFLNKEALSAIGLFTESGQMRPEVLKFLKEQKYYPENDNRNKGFKSRINCEDVEAVQINRDGSSNCSLSVDSSSEIKSDSEI